MEEQDRRSLPPGPAVSATLSRREVVLSACERCRHAKVKCDSVRPSCSRCLYRELSCIYDVEAGVTRAVALKRSVGALKVELSHLQQVYRVLQTSSTADIHRFLEVIRHPYDPADALRHFHDDLSIVDRRLPMPLPSLQMRSLDAQALSQAKIKVPARPWTAVAGDGMISHLISSFLEYEQPLLMQHIDAKVFLIEMVEGDATSAEFCTPLLVNAICALSMISSPYNIRFDIAQGALQNHFFDEARKLFDNEAGRASVPTLQALTIMYVYCSAVARDRAGLIFRLAAGDMYNRLRMGYVPVPNPHSKYTEESRQQLLSRAAWGLFCLETKICFAYHQPSMMKPPVLQRTFNSIRVDSNRSFDMNVFFEADCTISVLLSQISCLDSNETFDPKDSEAVRQLGNALDSWHAVLPHLESVPPSLRRYHYYLEALYHLAYVLLFRRLCNLHSVLLYEREVSVAQTIAHCQAIESNLSQWSRINPTEFTRGCSATLFFRFICIFVLLPVINVDPEAETVLAVNCRFLFNISQYWPAAKVMLKGLEALALETHTLLPQSCKQYIEGWAEFQSSDDIPVCWVIRHNYHGDWGGISLDKRGSEDFVNEIGKIISRWSARSVSD